MVVNTLMRFNCFVKQYKKRGESPLFLVPFSPTSKSDTYKENAQYIIISTQL